MRKKTFKDLVGEVPKPKKLTLDERLPHVFDLFWDYKTFRDVLRGTRGSPTQEHLRLLRESGWDTTDLPTMPRDEAYWLPDED